MSYYINNEKLVFNNFNYQLSSYVQEHLYNKEMLSHIYRLKINLILNESKFTSCLLMDKIRQYIELTNDNIDEIFSLYENLEEWFGENFNKSYSYVESTLKKKELDKESFSQLELSIKTLDKRTKRLIEKETNFTLFERMVDWIQEVPYLISQGLFLDEIKELTPSCELKNDDLTFSYCYEENYECELKNDKIKEDDDTAIAA